MTPIWRCPACGKVVVGPYVVKALKKCSTAGEIEVHIAKAEREEAP